MAKYLQSDALTRRRRTGLVATWYGSIWWGRFKDKWFIYRKVYGLIVFLVSHEVILNFEIEMCHVQRGMDDVDYATTWVTISTKRSPQDYRRRTSFTDAWEWYSVVKSFWFHKRRRSKLMNIAEGYYHFGTDHHDGKSDGEHVIMIWKCICKYSWWNLQSTFFGSENDEDFTLKKMVSETIQITIYPIETSDAITQITTAMFKHIVRQISATQRDMILHTTWQL